MEGIVMDDDHNEDEGKFPDFKLLCDEVEKEMNRLPIPGAVLGISFEGSEFTSGFGVTNLEHPLEVNADTLFQIGSITKTYLATAIMRLVEMEKLELDRPIRTYYPELKLMDEDAASRVTMRHLLTHTGGWVGDYFNDFGLGEDALSRMITKMAELEQLSPLGEVWSYNNSGFYLAGRVLEILMRTHFEDAMKELVLDPLGLNMSFFFAHEVITHRVAVGHKVVDEKPEVARPWAIGRAAHPAGGIVCSVKDLLRYARFHMGDGTAPDGKRLLTRESLELLRTPLYPSTGISMTGLSWVITPLGDTQMISHGGGTNGQISHLRIVPSRNFGVAVFTNSERGGILCNEIVNSATKRYLDLSLPEASPLKVPEEQLLTYTGKFEVAMGFCDIDLQDGGLVLQVTPKGGFPTPESPPSQAPPSMRLGLYAEDRGIILDEPMKDGRVEFFRDKDGKAAWFRFGGRVHAKKD
jgi:CubicO group peptidase (beta-lactamase class C family)